MVSLDPVTCKQKKRPEPMARAPLVVSLHKDGADAMR